MPLSLSRRSLIASPALAFSQAVADRRAAIAALEKQVAGLPEKFERRKHRELNGWAMPYRLFHAKGSGKLPLVVYLHGSGGLGADNVKQISGGNLVPANCWATPEWQARHACFVVAPQTDRGWIKYATLKVPEGARPQPVAGLGEAAAACLDLIKGLLSELPIDDRRIYLTGQSMGGGGAWHLLAHAGNQFAAVMPYCGSTTLETGAERPNIPVWNFHGDADETVSVNISRTRIEARRKAGGKPIHTEYAGVGHMVSPWACTEPTLADWLFAQRA